MKSLPKEPPSKDTNELPLPPDPDPENTEEKCMFAYFEKETNRPIPAEEMKVELLKPYRVTLS